MDWGEVHLGEVTTVGLSQYYYRGTDFMLIFTPWVNLESPINLTYKSLAGSQSTESDAIQAQEEHTSSTQKGLSWSLDSNPGPCCEATEATS